VGEFCKTKVGYQCAGDYPAHTFFLISAVSGEIIWQEFFDFFLRI